MNNDFIKNTDEAMSHIIKSGAFLTVQNGTKINTMTIGWANIGVVWGKPIFTIFVRKSRYTHALLENTDEFTVSIPLNDEMKSVLISCGTKSGRDINKIEEYNLNLLSGKTVSTPIIDGCMLNYECKVVYKQDMDPALLSDKIKESMYSDNDFHTLYYGEIVNTYRK
jgi:flavin reductase (DIM6/NTAB) family NADH-FMN oxidoreductase RutF